MVATGQSPPANRHRPIGRPARPGIIRHPFPRADCRLEEGTMAAGETPIKQAVDWLDGQLRERPQADRLQLVDEAARRFDLSPLDTEFLMRHLTSRGPRS
jgi:hypothetical protein